MKDRITIVGAGNVGTQFAVHCAEAGYHVTMFGSKPKQIQRELTIIDKNDQVIHKGKIQLATSDATEAFAHADIIFVVMPATLMKKNAALIEPFAKQGMKICLVPGTGGGECAFKKCIEKGATLFGVQRVPSVARLVEYGKTVRAVGYRDEMYVAALPHKETKRCCQLIENIFHIRTLPLPNYLNITLTPSNPILHTTRLKNLFGSYRNGVVYKTVPLFYEDWNDETSALLFQCDDEVQEMCGQLKEFDLSYVKSLRIHYESQTITAMTRKISSIDGFKGLTSPVIPVEGGFVPDFKSRYFTADFSYGLSILIQVADFLDLAVPNMRGLYDWYNSVAEKQDEFQFRDYDIDTFDKFVEFYRM